MHVGEEDTCPIKDIQSAHTDRRSNRNDLPQSRHKAFVSLLRSLAKELKRDGPGFRRGPAQPVVRGSEAARQAIKPVDHLGSQRNSDKKAHGTPPSQVLYE